MLELKNISGGYGKTKVICDVSAEFNDGEISVIIGANGCGKSTLLSLCNGSLSPTRGEILADGKNISTLPRKNVAQKISLLSQGRVVPEITVERLVLHGRFPWLGYPRVYRGENRAIAKAAMEQAGIIEKRFSSLPKLSGGERQKAFLAMVLAQNTTTVLLDEPATHLDIAHQLELLEILRTLKNHGKCVVAVLHDLSQAFEIADRIFVMQNGKITAADTPENIFSSGAAEKAFGVKLERKRLRVFALRVK
jgi:iron complex transport system ATP-binding protein